MNKLATSCAILAVAGCYGLSGFAFGYFQPDPPTSDYAETAARIQDNIDAATGAIGAALPHAADNPPARLIVVESIWLIYESLEHFDRLIPPPELAAQHAAMSKRLADCHEIAERVIQRKAIDDIDAMFLIAACGRKKQKPG